MLEISLVKQIGDFKIIFAKTFISSLRFSTWFIVRLEFKQPPGFTVVANLIAGDNICRSMCQYLAQLLKRKKEEEEKKLVKSKITRTLSRLIDCYY